MNRLQIFCRCTLLVAVFLIITGCSTKKNTWGTRTLHTMTARYNVQFNGKMAFDEGLKTLNENHQDDYSSLLPLYTVSNHEAAKGLASKMDITIEKCRKSIKLHSIKTKPKRDDSRMRDPKYLAFYHQTEFNQEVKRAWILLGQAEFYKADFIGAIGTFSYIIRHYPNENAVVVESSIWLARSYAELGWFYEAEATLDKINENNIGEKLNGIYAATKADLLLKQQRYAEAIPFLKLAIEKERNKYQRTRFEFVLGQLYELTDQPKLATIHFNNAKKLAPTYQMQFNAELRALQSESNAPRAIKSLEKMAKKVNNKEYLDQIYTAIGNQYLTLGQEEKAIASFRKAMALSTRNGIDKAVVALKLGDLFYDKRQYLEASPCYDTVIQFMPNTHAAYPRAQLRSEVLGELTTYTNNIMLQDSLLHLSSLSQQEQLAIVAKIIEQVKLDDLQAAKDSANAAARSHADSQRDDFDAPVPLGVGASVNWYFYNTQLTNTGKSEFKRKWGSRPLEDNWRRQNKMNAPTASTEDLPEDQLSLTSTNELTGDTIASKKDLPQKYDPAFYLAQIPKTQEQKQAANNDIANALYQIGGIYLVKLRDDEQAAITYREFQRRFPTDDRKVETYYYVYQIEGRKPDLPAQAEVRNQIISEFPNSKYTTILSQPDYVERTLRMFQLQDSIYQATYNAYSKGDFATVLGNYDYMKREYSLSELMPKFDFLNALTLGKMGERDSLYSALTTIIEKYPDSDITPMSRDILALMGQGKKSVEDTTPSSLIALRNQQAKAEADSIANANKNIAFTGNVQEAHNLILIPKNQTQGEINQLLYDVAAFNFTKFMIKDFDLDLRTMDGKQVLVISNMESKEEALWYERMLLSDSLFTGRITYDVCDRVLISAVDMALIGNGRTWADYIKYVAQ